MQTAKRYLIIAGAVALVTIINVLVAQRSAIAQIQATLVKDADNPARQPFSAECANYGASVDGCTFITVPAGKRLVIEMFEVRTHWDVPVVSLLYTGLYHYFPVDYPSDWNPVNAPTHSGLVFAVHQTRYYADPGTKIVASSVSARSTSTVVGASYVISGYFVDIP